MAQRWSDRILLAHLEDEPALSEELADVQEKLEGEETACAATSSVVLDFAEVSYCNSSNLAQLLSLRRLTERRGARLILCSLSDAVWSLFLTARLDRAFDFAPSCAEALATLRLAEGSSEAG
ncbi:MAG: anti-sigma factor antagonist [Planctomycetota bacterium]|nr:MAG: anti-sigma factor antagonist [Planctomycetota bacterium]